MLIELTKVFNSLNVKDETRQELLTNMANKFDIVKKSNIYAKNKLKKALEVRILDPNFSYENAFEFLKDEEGIEEALNAIEELLEASVAYRDASAGEIKKIGDAKLATMKTACTVLSNIKEQLKEKIEEEEEEIMEKSNQEGFKILAPEEINDNNYLKPIFESEEKVDLPVEKVLYDNYYIKVEYLQDTHDLTTFPVDTLSIPLIRIEGKNMAISPCTIEYVPFMHSFRVNSDRPDWLEDDVVNVFRCGYDQISATIETEKYIKNKYSFIINLKTKDSNTDMMEEILKKINLVLVNLRLFKLYKSKDTIQPKLPRINGFDPYCVKLIKDISKLDISARTDEKGNYRYYSRGLLVGDDITKNKMLEELCAPFKSGVLYELVKAYFDIIED